MSKDHELKNKKRVETVEKYKSLGYRYCVYSLRINSSSVNFYKTYLAAIRCRSRKLENQKNILVTIFYLNSNEIYKVIY